jgi:exonuclease III
MKILSYNINRSTQEKIDKIMQFNADVFILPEVACPSQVKVPEGYRMEWMGNYDFKGLGVIWKSGMKAEIPQWYNPCHQYFLPIIIENKLIMAAWPTRTDDNAPKDYPQIAMETLQEYAPYLKEFPTVISGDMNCYKGQAGETKQYSIEAIFSFLEGMGYVSAYHQKTGELLGKESKTTYYHRFNENSPFFLDYTFSNVAF